MPSILIETGELRSLASWYENEAASLGNARAALSGQVRSTRLATQQDLRLGRAAVYERHARVSSSMRSIESSLREEAREFRSLADWIEHKENEAGWLPLAIVPNFSSLGRATATAIVLPKAPVAAAIDRAIAGLRGLGREIYDGAKSVGRFMVDTQGRSLANGLALIREAPDAFRRAKEAFEKWLRNVLIEAWNRIWDRVTALFDAVAAGVQALVGVVADLYDASPALVKIVVHHAMRKPRLYWQLLNIIADNGTFVVLRIADPHNPIYQEEGELAVQRGLEFFGLDVYGDAMTNVLVYLSDPNPHTWSQVEASLIAVGDLKWTRKGRFLLPEPLASDWAALSPFAADPAAR